MATNLSLEGLPSFYGRGISFPIRLDATGTRINVSRDEELIRESMSQIINTDTTERPFVTRNGIPFGTRCRRILFDHAETAIDIIRFEVKRALDTWEPRIITDSVDGGEEIDEHGGSAILAVVHFRYRSTNRADNFVTPFRYSRPQ